MRTVAWEALAAKRAFLKVTKYPNLKAYKKQAHPFEHHSKDRHCIKHAHKRQKEYKSGRGSFMVNGGVSKDMDILFINKYYAEKTSVGNKKRKMV